MNKGWPFHYDYPAVCEVIDSDTLEKGWKIFSDRRVDRIRWQRSTAKAVVLDKYFFDVVLDPRIYADSVCSCGHQHCAHQTALFFAVCQFCGYNPEQVWNKMNASIADRNKSANATRQLQKKQAGKSQMNAALMESSTMEQWHQHLTELADRTVDSHLPGIVSLSYSIERQIAPLIANWDQAQGQLFRIYACLHLIHQIDRDILKQVTDTYGFPNQHYEAFNRLFERLLELNLNINRERLEEIKFKRYLDGIADFLHEHTLSAKQSSFDWLYLYRILWGGFLIQETVVNREMLRLNKRLDEPQLGEREQDQVLGALSHFAVLENQDEAAFAMLNRMKRFPHLSHIHVYLRTFLLTEDKERLLTWLDKVLPFIKEASDQERMEYLEMWSDAVSRWGCTDSYLYVLKMLLPATYEPYQKWLLRLKLYKTWVDLQMALSFSPLHMASEDMKKVEKAQLSLLLPWYHQSVEKFIAQKNRAGYRHAVQCLKKLEHYYKKLKRTDQWRYYLEGLIRQHTRLRALHEEMKKGGLAG